MLQLCSGTVRRCIIPWRISGLISTYSRNTQGQKSCKCPRKISLSFVKSVKITFYWYHSLALTRSKTVESFWGLTFLLVLESTVGKDSGLCLYPGQFWDHCSRDLYLCGNVQPRCVLVDLCIATAGVPGGGTCWTGYLSWQTGMNALQQSMVFSSLEREEPRSAWHPPGCELFRKLQKVC